ncbi:hypothetical protein ACKWTF_007101 [Chironomus riparius]
MCTFFIILRSLHAAYETIYTSHQILQINWYFKVISIMLYLVLILAIIYLIYKWGTNTFDYFEKRGIKYNKPLFLVGSRLSILLKNSSMVDSVQKTYKEFRNEKISGMFEFKHPTYFIRDPDIIKRLAIKEFDHFTDHRLVLDEEVEPLFAKGLFGLTGQKWKDMRATLSPAFTGSKMRLMFNLMNKVGSQMTASIRNQIDSGKNNEVEFKEFARNFTLDIIATCAFGIEVNSFEHPDNEFIKIARKATNFGDIPIYKFIGFFLFPKLMAKLNIKFLDKDLYVFFDEVLSDTIQQREKKGIVRNDMIDLLLQAKKGSLTHDESQEETLSNIGFATVEESDIGKHKVKRTWTDEDLMAQAFIFFFAGFETVSTVMTFMAYELLLNPDVQTKLQKEIDEVYKSLGGKELTYEHVQGMKYMDMVVSETLRKWPAAPVVDRNCTKPFTLEYDDKKIDFEIGRNFYVPIYAIHHDPLYYENPEKFDPERFSDENKDKIANVLYAPFGIGPRNCIGSRFALLEVKTIFYYLLLNFSFEATSKTKIPIQFVKIPSIFQIEGGLDIALAPRSK